MLTNPFAGVWLMLVFALLVGMPTMAQNKEAQALSPEELETQVIRIADLLRCPICQGLSVKESETSISVNMKNEIRTRLKAGQSQKEILLFFEQRYGEWILREPKATGFAWLIWLSPLWVLLIGGWVLYTFLKTHKKSPPSPIQPDLTEEEESIIQEKFNKWQRSS